MQSRRTAAPVLLFALFAACAHAPQREAVRKYVMVMGANHAGSETVSVSDRTTTADFEFNDRGRGPSTHTVLTVDARGIPVSELTTGVDYLKAPVREELTNAGGRSHFHNTAEEGDGPATAFYVGMSAPPEETAVLVRALLKNGGRLPLLPAGEARLTKGESVFLDGVRATRFEISGLGFTPVDVWLDDHDEFFASVDSWSSLIRDGHEGSIQRLLDATQAAARQRGEAMAKQLTRRPAAIAIVNARLFDPESMTESNGTTILVRGNRIVAVGPSVEVPPDAERIDAGGHTVIPGLWDMHVHLGDIDGPLDIASGVTSVRDMANDIDYVTALRKSFADGTLVGPRVLLAGFVDGPGPYAGPSKVLVDSEDEIRKAIDRYASLGYLQIKIYSSMRPELVPFITSYAHSKGLRVSGHVPAFMYAEDAVREGYDEIQHANMLLLNFLRDVKDTRTPLRFTAIGERGSGIDLTSPEAERFFDLLVAHKTVIDPTVATFEGMLTARPGVMPEGVAAIAGELPPQVRRGFLAGGLPVDASTDERYKAGFAKMIELVSELHRHGIPIVAGTDDLAGFTLHRELELYVTAGIPAPEVLRIATLGAARVMHRDDELGTVAAGKLADLVIVDGDPAADISALRKPLWVIKDGLLFDSHAVYRAMGVTY